jgi:ParB family chromosome partitioning protein
MSKTSTKEAPVDHPAESVAMIPIGQVHPAPDNLRRSLGDMEELTASVKANGILQPITVEPRDHDGYQVVMGHRRLAAAQLAKLERIPAIVRTFKPGDRIVAMGVENLQRENLSPTEEAELYRRLTVDEGLTQRGVAAITGSSQARVAKRLALLKLPELAVRAVDSGRLGVDEAAELASLAEEPGFAGAVEKILSSSYSHVTSREVPRYVKSLAGETAAADKRNETRDRLEAEGKKVVGEATASWQAGPGYPARTLDQVGGKKFDAAKHATLKCATWWISYEGEAIEACEDYRNHESQGGHAKQDREFERKSQELARQREAQEKLTNRRRDFIQLLLDGNLGADARDHVVRQAYFLYEPEWDLAMGWLGIPQDEDVYDPAANAWAWIAEAPSRRQLQASLAVVLEHGEHLASRVHGGLEPYEAGERRQHFEFLSFSGYKLAPEEEALLELAPRGEVEGGDEEEGISVGLALAHGATLSPELSEAAAEAGVDVTDHAAVAAFLAHHQAQPSDESVDEEAGEPAPHKATASPASYKAASSSGELEQPLADLDSLIASVRRKLDRVVVERGRLEQATSVRRRGPHADGRRKELEAVKQSELSLQAELAELEERRNDIAMAATDALHREYLDALPKETASQRMERERRAKIEAAKRQLEEVEPLKPGSPSAPGTCTVCGCHGDCEGGCAWVVVDDGFWQCSTHATADALA